MLSIEKLHDKSNKFSTEVIMEINAAVKYCAVAQSEVKCVTHARRHFPMQRIASHTAGVLIVP